MSLHRGVPLLALVLTLLAACGGDQSPVTVTQTPDCDPKLTVSPTLVGVAAGGTATLTASVVPCNVAKRVSWVVTDTSIARVASTSDTTAVVTGGHTGNTTVLASVAAFPGAHGVVVVQVQ